MKISTMTLALFLAALGGCAVTPAEIREQGLKSEIALRLPPKSAAECSARAIENAGDFFWGHHQPTVRDGLQPGTAELAIIGVMVVDFVPNGTGAIAKIAEATHVVEAIRKRYVAALAGC